MRAKPRHSSTNESGPHCLGDDLSLHEPHAPHHHCGVAGAEVEVDPVIVLSSPEARLAGPREDDLMVGFFLHREKIKFVRL